MTRRTARFCILHIVLAVAVGSWHMAGVPLWPAHGLAQMASGVILAALGWGLIDAWRGQYEWSDWMAALLPMIGILGTVLGFIGAFSGYTASIAGDSGAAVSVVADGMSVSLQSTFLGVGASLWLHIVKRVVG